MECKIKKKELMRIRRILGKDGWKLESKGGDYFHLLEELGKQYSIDVSEFFMASPDDIRQGDKVYRLILGENGGIAYIITRGGQEDWEKAEQLERMIFADTEAI